MSMTFDEYIEKRVNQAVEEAVHKVSVNFANNIWNHGVHDLEKIAYFSELPLEEGLKDKIALFCLLTELPPQPNKTKRRPKDLRFFYTTLPATGFTYITSGAQ